MTTTYSRNNFEIEIDLTRDALLSDAGVALMKDRYLLKKYSKSTNQWVNLETSPQECFARASCEFASNQGHAQRLYEYASKNWMMFATPIQTNAGTERGMPISCFLNYVPDSVRGILEHHQENGFLSSYGGGIGGAWSDVRSDGTATSRGNVSSGSIPFINMMDTQMNAFQQGATRRGSYAAYMDIGHPEIEEFIDIRRPSGDINRRCTGTGFHHAVNLPDVFMERVASGGKWDLIDPHSKEVRKTVDARTLWFKVLTSRLETGEPYLHFTDTSNRALPDHLKKLDLKINNSNLCSEIFLPTSEERTAVCCLSSVNLEYYDDWKSEQQFIPDIVEMLDNVLESFIENAPPEMAKAVYSASQSRDIGLGSMGFHLYLQKKGLPFESVMAKVANKGIYKHIKESAVKASKSLALTRGEAPDAIGTGLRFSHLMAIAPNANISVICGNTSPSIEPFSANAFEQITLSGSFLIKNKLLDKLFKEKYALEGLKLEDTWSSIIVNKGSVQHLDFLSKEEKELFKTALELDPAWIVEHASTRQEFICQGQSVNLFLSPDIHKNDLHKIHFDAWKKGLKALYYCRSVAIYAGTSVSTPSREGGEKETPMNYTTDTECLACEG